MNIKQISAYGTYNCTPIKNPSFKSLRNIGEFRLLDYIDEDKKSAYEILMTAKDIDVDFQKKGDEIEATIKDSDTKEVYKQLKTKNAWSTEFITTLERSMLLVKAPDNIVAGNALIEAVTKGKDKDLNVTELIEQTEKEIEGQKSYITILKSKLKPDENSEVAKIINGPDIERINTAEKTIRALEVKKFKYELAKKFIDEGAAATSKLWRVFLESTI